MGRMEKINAQLRREISRMLIEDVRDPRVLFVSITSVDVTPDLQHARVRFSVLGPEERVPDAQAGLDRARGFIRRLIARRVRLRHTPEVEFFYDSTLVDSIRLERTFEDLRREAAPPAEGADGSESET